MFFAISYKATSISNHWQTGQQNNVVKSLLIQTYQLKR